MPLKNNESRREFMGKSAALAGGALGLASGVFPGVALSQPVPEGEPFQISIAEWSLHRTLRKKQITNLDFPVVARKEFGIDAIEYVNQFFKQEVGDWKYMADLKQRCDDHGVKSLLIMVDGEGRLGDPDDGRRAKAVENHHRWLHAASFLGCHSIRVNAGSKGTWEEQAKLAVDGLSRLSELALGHGLNVIVENHGGLSSNGKWLSEVIKSVGMGNCGTLPDFGNFRVSKGEMYDRYRGVTELMPFAKAVSAKSHKFNGEGDEVNTDYMKMMKIVLDAGYRGYVGIEWEGGDPGEYEGVKLTKKFA